MNVDSIVKPLQVAGVTRTGIDRILKVLDSALYEVLKQGGDQTTFAIADDLADHLVSDLDIAAAAVVAEEIASIKAKGTAVLTKAEAKKIATNLDKRLAGFGIEEQALIQDRIVAIYDLSRTGSSTAAGVTTTFNITDELSRAALAQEQVYWVGEFYNEGLSQAIRKTVDDVLLIEGLGRQEVAIALETALSPISKIPAGFKGTATSYYESLGIFARTRAAAFATVESLIQAKVDVYEFFAVLDERTSQICLHMNGQQFQVASAVASRDAYLEAATPEEVVDIFGWKSVEDVQAAGLTQPGVSLTASQSSSLVDLGVHVPPLHFRCRSSIEVVETL